MAESERYADDITELWGPREETAVEPLVPDPHPGLSSGNGSTNGIGAHASGREQPQDLARLVEAIAGRQLPAATRDDLEAMRTELETIFSQQLAVAVYELMASSNERLGTFEDHVNGRLAAVNEAFDGRVAVLQAEVAGLRRAVAVQRRPVLRRRTAVRRRRGWNSAP